VGNNIIFKGLSKKPIFIGGLMKSGTTLLRVLLGQHPNLYAGFESHWYEDDIRHNWFNPDSERLKLSLSLLDINGDEYKELHSIKSSDPDREFIDIVMEYCSKRAGKERWVEKTPDNIRYRSLIKKQWPDAKFIHVIREYKDIYASWKINRKESIQDFIDKVKYIYEGNLDYLGKQTDDYLEVNYNDLVLNTEATMRNVFRYIGEQWHDSCKELDIDMTSEERKKFKNLMNRESATLVSLSKPIFAR